MKEKWSQYFQKSLNQPHRPNLQQAIELDSVDVKHVIDVGCGVGNDIDFMLGHDYSCVAFDVREEAIDICRERFDGNNKLRLSVSSLEEFDYQSCSILLASHSFYFCREGCLDDVLSRALGSIQSGGVFVGDLLGKNDSWVASKEHDVSQVTKEDIDNYFKDFDIISLLERDELAKTRIGTEKHWHHYSILARKL